MVSLGQGSLLNEIGDDLEFAYFPHGGTVLLLTAMRDGKSIATATIGRDGIVGGMAGLGLHTTLTRAMVQVPVVASQIAVGPFRHAVKESEALRDLLVRWSEVLLCQVQMTAACHVLHPIEARLARSILQAGDRIEPDLIPLTQQLLSEMLGARRSTIGEVAGRFQADGLIRYRRGILKIADRPRLEAAACECYAAMKDNAALLLPVRQ
jgi:CRP-like cAMP-binding protein